MLHFTRQPTLKSSCSLLNPDPPLDWPIQDPFQPLAPENPNLKVKANSFELAVDQQADTSTETGYTMFQNFFLSTFHKTSCKHHSFII